MEQDAAFYGEPLLKRIIGGLSFITFLKEPCRTSPTAELMAYGVVGTEVFIFSVTRQLVERTNEVRGQGK